MPTIGINDFVRRQTSDSEFTHFDDGGDEGMAWERVAELALACFDQAKPGYRDGVILVPVPPEGFYTAVTVLKEGDVLVGEYKARRPMEEPRKTLRVRRPSHRDPSPAEIEAGIRRVGEKVPLHPGKQRCVAVDVVLYRRDVLEESAEDCTGADWDIVSVNGRVTPEDQPIEPMTLIANHFQLDGGTATNMSPEQFEAALRESVLYWKDKALLDV